MAQYKRVLSVNIRAGTSNDARAVIRGLNQLACLREQTVYRATLDILREVLPEMIAKQRELVKQKKNVA